MRIHTSLTSVELCIAAIDAGTDVHLEFTRHGSRKRAHAFEVTLTGYGARHTRRKNHGQRGADADYAATWSDWGRFLAGVFDRDPDAICGHYDGDWNFNAQTYGLFATPGAPGRNPATLANEVRSYAAVPNVSKTRAISIVADDQGLSEYIVKSAIFGE